jgi:trans-feruloyl-CoA hydratase/vanillin synthase
MKYDTLLVETAPSGVTTVTLHRPDQRNAMNPRLHEEMTALLDALWYDASTRVIIITGSGNAFCAGMDLKEYFIGLRERPSEYDRITRLAVEWRTRKLKFIPKPTIAMVNGYCFGGAFSIVEGCDLAFADRAATFGLSEVNFKMFPGGSVSKSLTNILRPRDALFYALTGRKFDGTEAARIGLINAAVAGGELAEFVTAIAEEIARKDAEALYATKEAYRHSASMDWEAAMSYTRAREYELTWRQSDEWRAGSLTAFARKEFRPGLGAQDEQLAAPGHGDG